MTGSRSRPSRVAIVIFVLAVLAVAAAVVGCRPAMVQSSGATLDQFPPPRPAPWDLSAPDKAVRSYLDWVTYSYRMANSDVSTPTMEPTETVRVDSYIQLNRESGKGIAQTIVRLDIKKVVVNGKTAEVGTFEEYDYRYYDLAKPATFISPIYRATYDATYTVVQGRDKRWRVDHVVAVARGEVK